MGTKQVNTVKSSNDEVFGRQCEDVSFLGDAGAQRQSRAWLKMLFVRRLSSVGPRWGWARWGSAVQGAKGHTSPLKDNVVHFHLEPPGVEGFYHVIVYKTPTGSRLGLARLVVLCTLLVCGLERPCGHVQASIPPKNES